MKIPEFSTLEEELAFWQLHCAGDYIDDTREATMAELVERQEQAKTRLFLLREIEKIREVQDKLGPDKARHLRRIIREAVDRTCREWGLAGIPDEEAA